MSKLFGGSIILSRCTNPGLGKCRILGILNITFKYLLKIIMDLLKEPPKNIKTIPQKDSPSSGFAIWKNNKSSSANPSYIASKVLIQFIG